MSTFRTYKPGASDRWILEKLDAIVTLKSVPVPRKTFGMSTVETPSVSGVAHFAGLPSWFMRLSNKHTTNPIALDMRRSFNSRQKIHHYPERLTHDNQRSMVVMSHVTHVTERNDHNGMTSYLRAIYVNPDGSNNNSQYARSYRVYIGKWKLFCQRKQ